MRIVLNEGPSHQHLSGVVGGKRLCYGELSKVFDIDLHSHSGPAMCEPVEAAVTRVTKNPLLEVIHFNDP